MQSYYKQVVIIKILYVATRQGICLVGELLFSVAQPAYFMLVVEVQ